MGTYSDKHDDDVVESKAFDLALADGVEDPEIMTYESDGGVPYPYGPIWSRYIGDAVTALDLNGCGNLRMILTVHPKSS